MMSEEKEKKVNSVFYINHSGELLIWLLILLIPAVIFFFTQVNKAKSPNEYNLFMPDVDGLIVGSPVRAMGIEIGHVTEIRPTNEEVFVQFVITDKSVKIPQGTIATVEFSGMAGSKSLELYLSDKNTYIDSSVPIIAVSPPKRLSDAAGLLNEMFKKIGNIIAVSTRFGAKISEIEFPKHEGNVNDAKEFLHYTNDIIDIQQQRVDDLEEKLNAAKNRKKQFKRDF